MVNIRASIINFNNTERYEVKTVDLMGRSRNTTFLTEKGLYKVLSKNSKKSNDLNNK